ncbi:hypothetical protein VSQ48_06700 [Candidatus Ventrimonas sp. KK005]
MQDCKDSPLGCREDVWESVGTAAELRLYPDFESRVKNRQSKERSL